MSVAGRDTSNTRSDALPANSPSSFLPVWESIHEELARSSGLWLSELARWYEADWQIAVHGGPRPVSANVLEVLAPDRKSIVSSVLNSIDQRYEIILKEMERPTVNDAEAATFVWSPNLPADLPETLAPGERRQLADTIHVAQDSTANEKNVEIPLNSPTMDFSNVPEKSLHFSVGEKPTSSSKPDRTRDGFPKIDGYTVKKVLGRGGMGVVYLGHQLGIDRPVAIKMILGGNFASKVAVERFKAEARAVGKLQHENIVRIYDSGWHQGLPYFSLEYVDGASLSEKIDAKPLDPVESAKIAISLSKAVDFAHLAGIVHRDLKPANVLMTKDGIPKLSDFGLAKLENEQNDYSRTGDIVGSPGYMAPEQARGDSDVGAPADVYGLGAILYCMLSGRPPFMAAKASDTLIQLLTKEPITVSQLQPGVPRDLETICMKCLEKSPEKRYASAASLMDDLRKFVNGEPISARPITKLERAARWAKRKPLIAGLSATAAALGAVLMIGGPVVAVIIDGQKQDVLVAKQQAVDNANSATEAKQEAEENAKLAEANAETASKNADAAQDQQKQAVDALKSLVFEVQRELKDRPRLQLLRKKLLDVARDGLKRMEAAGTDAASRNIISASIYRRLGDTNLEVGSANEAVKEYSKCLDVLKTLQAAGELKKGARHNMSTAYDLLGQASRRAGKLDDAKKYWLLCLEERRAWLEESKIEPKEWQNVLQNVAVTLGQLTTLARVQGDLPAARTLLEEGLKYRKSYVDQRPGQYDPQEQLLGIRRELAMLRFDEGDAEGAMSEMRSVITDFDVLAKSNSNSQAAQWNSLLFKADLATQLLYMQKVDDALKLYTLVVDGQQKLLNEDPDKLQFQEGLAGTIYGMATAELRKGDLAASQAAYVRALKLAEHVLELDSDNLPRQLRVALFKARTQDFEGAQKLVEPLNVPGLEAGTLYNIACIFAQLTSPDNKTAKPDADRARTTAIKLLSTAIANGFDRPMDLSRDPDLDPLRSFEEFKILLTAK